MLDEINGPGTPFRIIVRAECSTWFEKHDVDMLGRSMNRLASYGDPIMRRVDPGRQIRNQVAVHPNDAFGDQVFTSTTGSKACTGKHLLDALATRSITEIVVDSRALSGFISGFSAPT